VIITDWHFYALAIPAVLLVGLSKSGFLAGLGSFATPMLALSIPAPQAAAIMLPLLMVMDATGVHKLWKERDPAMLRLLLPAGLVGVVIGMAFFGSLSSAQVSVVIGVVTLVFLAQRRLGLTLEKIQHSDHWGRLMSMISGFTSFIAHAGGPPMMAYTLPLKLAPITLTATMAVHFAAINLAKWVPYAVLGLFDARNLLTALVLVPVAPLGVWLGVWLTRRMKAATFYLVADVVMFVTGVQLVAKAWG
jgi:uncharacterized protein